MHKNKSHLYLFQQKLPDSEHMKEEENEYEKRLFLNQIVFFIHNKSKAILTPKKSPLLISGGNNYVEGNDPQYSLTFHLPFSFQYTDQNIQTQNS